MDIINNLKLNHKRKLYIVSSVVSCVLIVAIESTNVFSQNQQLTKEYTRTQLTAKLELLNAAMDRVTELKKRGYMPRTIEGAKKAVKIAETEFNGTDIIIVKPLFTLVELLGKQRRYEEAGESLEKIYIIIGSGKDDTAPIYAIGYRIWIARLYIQWNKLEKAESTLMAAQKIIEYSKLKLAQEFIIYTNDPFPGFTRSINTELEKVHALQEANSYNIRKKK